MASLGNHTVQRILQTQLGAGQKGHEFEREANATAEQIVAPDAAAPRCACGRPVGPGGVCAECARRRAALSAAVPDNLPLSVQRVLRTSGRPLDPLLRDRIETVVGGDLGDVRVHTGTGAAQAARDLNARAFTTGRDIVFGHGEYAPETAAGRRLIAHEATHALQQAGGAAVIQRVPGPDPGGGSVAANQLEVHPCDVNVSSLTNEGLVLQLQRGRAFLSSHERGPDYYDYANLMRRLTTERMQRARNGHVWLAEEPPALPTTVYQLLPGSSPLEVMVIPADAAAERGMPTMRPESSVLTRRQFEDFLQRKGIPTIDAESYFAQQDPRRIDPLRVLVPPPPQPRQPDIFSLQQRGFGVGPGGQIFNPFLMQTGTGWDPFGGAFGTAGVVGGGLYASPFAMRTQPLIVDPVLSPNVTLTSARSVSGGRVEWRGDLPEFASGWRGPNIILYQNLNPLHPQGNFEVFDWRQRFTGNLISVTHTLPESGTWTPASTNPTSNPTAVPDFRQYHTKFERAIGMEQPVKYQTAINRLNTALGTNLTPVDVAGRAFLAVNSDHVEPFRNDLEARVRQSPGDYATLLDALLRDKPLRITKPSGTVVINDWNSLQAARANNTITLAEYNSAVGDLATQARPRVISNGISTLEIARLENFRLQYQNLPPEEFNARFPPEYLDMVRLGGAGPAIWEGANRGGMVSAGMAGAFGVGRMIYNRDASGEAFTHLGIDVATGYGGGVIGTSLEQSVVLGTTSMLSESTGALAVAGRFGGRAFGGGLGGGVAAPLVTMAAMGLDPYHHYTGIDYAARGGRAAVGGAAAGAGGALATAGFFALAGSEVPIVGNAIGFLVGLGVYYIVDSTVGEDVERGIRLELGEGGCTGPRTPTPTPAARRDDVWPVGACFAADTPVRMWHGGERPIASLEEGDLVLGYDESCDTFMRVAVKRVDAHVACECRALELVDGRTVRVTDMHPLHADGIWRPAGSVEVGARLSCLSPNATVEPAAVMRIVGPERQETVYDLSVDGCHTYFAGGMLAHNKNI